MMDKIELEDRIEYRNEDGFLHREDGPAVEYLNGDKSWWVNGKRHREDGPATQWSIGFDVWYLSDACFLTKEEFENELVKLKLERLKRLNNE